MRFLVLVPVFLVLALPLRAATEAEAHRLFDKLQLREQLGDLSLDPSELPDGVEGTPLAEPWRMAVARHGDMSDFVDLFATELAQSVTEEDLVRLHEIADTPLSQEITRASVAVTRMDQAEMLDEGLALMARYTEDAPARLAALREMDRETGASERMMVIAMNIGVAMMRGMMAAADNPIDMSEAEIRELVETQSWLVRVEVNRALYASFALAYRDFSVEEIEQVTAWNKEPAMQRFNKVFFEVIEREFTIRMRAVGQDLVDAVSKPRL